MRVVITMLVLVSAACTKPNPDLCCNDAADCAAQGISMDHACAQGLICRGNQCIAEDCSDNTSCDASAPYCIGGTCAEMCTDDSQCPGFGGSDGDPFCVAGTCVQCRAGGSDCPASASVCQANICVQCATNSDCDGATPVCVDNACRGCGSNSDCASGACEMNTGSCLDASSLLYVSPGGTVVDDCTEADPCSLSHAFVLAAAGRDTILMAPGTYSESVAVPAGTTATVLGGGATLTNAITFSSSSKVGIESLNLQGGFTCTGTTASQESSIGFVNSTLGTGMAEIVIGVTSCNITMSKTVSPNFSTIQTAGMIITDSQVDLEQSSIGQVVLDSTTAAVTTSLTMNNSLLQALNKANGKFVTIDIAFTTISGPGPTDCVSDGTTVANIAEHISNSVFAAIPERQLTSTCYQNDMVNASGGQMLTTGLQAAVVQFVDPTHGDFHLTAASPAIDYASAAATDPIDFDGISRPQGNGRDVGAFEFH